MTPRLTLVTTTVMLMPGDSPTANVWTLDNLLGLCTGWRANGGGVVVAEARRRLAKFGRPRGPRLARERRRVFVAYDFAFGFNGESPSGRRRIRGGTRGTHMAPRRDVVRRGDVVRAGARRVRTRREWTRARRAARAVAGDSLAASPEGRGVTGEEEAIREEAAKEEEGLPVRRRH